MIGTVQYGLFLVFFVAIFALTVWALVDCLTRPARAFPAADKRTRPFWLGILVAAVLVAFLAMPLGGPSSFFQFLALLAAHQGAATFRGDASVRTWLQRIVVNTCRDRLRRARARPFLVAWPRSDLPAARPDTATELATRLAVHEALAELPVEQRVAVVLVDVQGCAVAEAAEILEVPVGTVKSRCARGRARLAVLLGHLREETP